jgi:hypothetical protein
VVVVVVVMALRIELKALRRLAKRLTLVPSLQPYYYYYYIIIYGIIIFFSAYGCSDLKTLFFCI